MSVYTYNIKAIYKTMEVVEVHIVIYTLYTLSTQYLASPRTI